MPASASQRLLSGEAWDDFCDVLRQAGHAIDDVAEITDLDRAEWYRFCTRLVRVGLERFVENCEPTRPRLREIPWRTSINVTCPDQDHLLAELADAAGDYVIEGDPGDVPYFVIAAWSATQPRHPGDRNWAPEGMAGLERFDPATLTTGAFVSSEDLTLGADGRFTIALSRQRQPGNWLELREDTVGLLVRVVHHRRDDERSPTFRIRRAGGAAPGPLDATEVADGLAKTAQMALAYASLVRSWKDSLAEHPNRLRFSQERYLSNGGVPDRHFVFGYWAKPADQALVIEFTPPDCAYWIFQLCNIWQENLDNYEDGQGYVNNTSALAGGDGVVRVVVADVDPGISGNWIDSAAHTTGIMGLRFIRSEAPPPVTVRLVDVQVLADGGEEALGAGQTVDTGEVVP